jgi:hypothetical protein
VAWATLIVLVAVSAFVAGLALALDYRRARLEIAAGAAESRDRAVLEMYRLETYRDLVGKAADEPRQRGQLSGPDPRRRPPHGR